jgi:hypothetical protein
MVLLSAQGMEAAGIAKVAFTSQDRVRDVIRNFNSHGFSSLYAKYKGGRRRSSRSRSGGRSRRPRGPGPPIMACREPVRELDVEVGGPGEGPGPSAASCAHAQVPDPDSPVESPSRCCWWRCWASHSQALWAIGASPINERKLASARLLAAAAGGDRARSSAHEIASTLTGPLPATGPLARPRTGVWSQF